jgi:hypothetical protein
LPLDPAQADMVYNAAETGAKAWIWDVAQDTIGKPVIVFATFPDDHNHFYHYACWNGSRWQTYRLLDAGRWFPQTPEGATEPEPNYSGGVVLDHENPANIYLSRQKKGIFEIEKWTTPDGGSHWSVEEKTADSRYNNIRPFAVFNAGSENPLQLLWMQFSRYRHYTDYRSAIKMGLEN